MSDPASKLIDVTHLAGTMTGADHAALRRYQDALYLATYWPDVENFRACVAAYDALISTAKFGAEDGADQKH